MFRDEGLLPPKEVRFNKWAPIWDQNDLNLQFTSLAMCDPIKDEGADIAVTTLIVGGLPFRFHLTYYPLARQSPQRAFFPFWEETTHEVGYLEDGTPRIKKTPLDFLIHPGFDSDDLDYTGRFVYRISFGNGKSASGLYVANQSGDAVNERLFAEGKDRIYLPNNPSLLAPTQIIFRKDP